MANFIGTTNEVSGRVATATGEDVRVSTPLGEVVGRAGVDSLGVGDEVVAVWRPERTQLSTVEPHGPNRWEGVIRTSMFLGAHTEYAVDAGGVVFRVWHAGSTLSNKGATRWVSVDDTHVRVLPAGTADDEAG